MLVTVVSLQDFINDIDDKIVDLEEIPEVVLEQNESKLEIAELFLVRVLIGGVEEKRSRLMSLFLVDMSISIKIENTNNVYASEVISFQINSKIAS